MNKLIIYFTLLTLTGCGLGQISSNELPEDQTAGECPPKSTVKLKQENVKAITLDNQNQTESGLVKIDQLKAYTFQGRSGQELNYQSDDDICIWVYGPNFQLVEEKKLLLTGQYILQVGSRQDTTNYALELSLKTEESTPSSSSSTGNKKKFDLTQTEAVTIVENWFKAKPKIFAPPFDRSLANRYTTGKLNYKTTAENGGGGMGWLEENSCYYKYDYTEIKKVISFNDTERQPSLTVKVGEKYTLHGPRSSPCSNRPLAYERNFTYWFAKDNGVWKINHSQRQ